VGKLEEKRSLRRYKSRWWNNIKMDLGEVGWGRMDCIDMAQNREQ
jgi:hypothetical protein